MISVITSLYNSNEYIKNYIKSVEGFSIYLTKNNINHEFIIISNSPNEEERFKLKEIEENTDIKSRIIICERESLYATWNRGVREAQYLNITFWNVDDIRFPNAIIDGLNKLKENVDIVYFPFIYKRYITILRLKILAKIKIFKTIEFDKNLFSRGMRVGPFFMVKKDVFNKVGYFDENFKIAGDFDWIVRAAKADMIFKKSDILGGIFTNDGNTLSGSKDQLQQEENKRILI
jgi:GT2 family glycosyltransferase